MNKIKAIIILIFIITLSLTLFISCNIGGGSDGNPYVKLVEVVNRWDYYFENDTHDDEYSVQVAKIWHLSHDDNGKLIAAGKYIPHPEDYNTRLDSVPSIWRETGTDADGNITVQRIELPRITGVSDPETELRHAEFRGTTIHAIAFKDWNDLGHYYYFDGTDNSFTDVITDGADTYNEIDYMEKIDGEIYIAATNENTDNPSEPYYDRLAVFKITDTGLEKQGDITLPVDCVRITTIHDLYIDGEGVIYLASNYQEGRGATREVYAGWHKNDGSAFTKVGDLDGVSDSHGQYVSAMVSPDDYIVYNYSAGEVEIIIDGQSSPELELESDEHIISQIDGMVQIGDKIFIVGSQDKERPDVEGSYIEYPTVWDETGAIDIIVDYDDIADDFEDILDSNFFIEPFPDESGYAINLNELYKENKYRVTGYVRRTFEPVE